MVRLRRIPAIRAANVLTLTIAIPYGILLLAWSLFLIFFLFPAGTNGQMMANTFLGVLVGSLFVWGFALVFLWISIAISCAFYNLIAGNLGGIELEFRTIPPDL